RMHGPRPRRRRARARPAARKTVLWTSWGRMVRPGVVEGQGMVDALQVKTVRWSRHSEIAARLAGEPAIDGAGSEPSARDFEQRAHDDAHHVVHEGVADDVDREHARVAREVLDADVFDRSNGVRARVGARSERGEVSRAHERARLLAQRVDVELVRETQGAT